MRSSPQVIGAAHDAIAYAKSQVEIELNGVGDNPIFLPEYQADPDRRQFPGLAGLAAAWTWRARPSPWCACSPSGASNRLTNPALSVGLPAFLTKGAGMFSGMMLSQYTADTLIVEQRILSAPASIALHPGRRRPGGFRLDGHEHRHQERPDPGQRLRGAGDRVHGGRPGAGFPRFHARQGRADRPPGHPQARRTTSTRTGRCIPTTTR